MRIVLLCFYHVQVIHGWISIINNYTPDEGTFNPCCQVQVMAVDLEAEALVFDAGGLPFWPEPWMVLRRLQLSKLATRIYDTHLALAATFFKVEETDSINFTPLQAAVRPWLLRVIYVVAWITLSRPVEPTAWSDHWSSHGPSLVYPAHIGWTISMSDINMVWPWVWEAPVARPPLMRRPVVRPTLMERSVARPTLMGRQWWSAQIMSFLANWSDQPLDSIWFTIN